MQSMGEGIGFFGKGLEVSIGVLAILYTARMEKA